MCAIYQKIDFSIMGYSSLPQSRLFTTRSEKPFENIEGKGENAGNQHFLLFPQCFQPHKKKSSF